MAYVMHAELPKIKKVLTGDREKKNLLNYVINIGKAMDIMIVQFQGQEVKTVSMRPIF